jgi:methionyl-tRNA formyltransferase
LVFGVRAASPPPPPPGGYPPHARKVERDELRIDWSRPADEIRRLIRVGGAFTTFRDKRLKVHRVVPATAPTEPAPALAPGEVAAVAVGVCVGTGSDPLVLVELQPEGKAAQSAGPWLNGARLAPGERLGS